MGAKAVASQAARDAERSERLRHELDDPSLQFTFFKSLGYRARLVAIAVLALVGLGLQIAFLNVYPGVPFLLAAVLLSWVAGFDAKVDKRSMHHDVAWETVPYDRVRKIKHIDKKAKRWDRSPIEISNGMGFALFALLGFGGFVLTGFSSTLGPDLPVIVGTDLVLLVASQWFSGIRSAFRQPDLMVKVDHVEQVMKVLEGEVEARGKLKAQLRMEGRDEERIPTDLKLAVQFEDPPEHFLGVQAQIVLNRVQGTPYPYFYAVVVTRPGHGLFDAARGVPRPRNVILETKAENDVEVAIIRQRTSRTSGYHTKPKVSRGIFRTAMRIGDRVLDRPSPA